MSSYNNQGEISGAKWNEEICKTFNEKKICKEVIVETQHVKGGVYQQPLSCQHEAWKQPVHDKFKKSEHVYTISTYIISIFQDGRTAMPY